MNRLARYWRTQPLLSVLLLAALLTRGLIPVGYMPAAGQGFFALELCTAPQYRLPASAHEHHPGVAHQHDGRKTPAGHDSPCPFAITALGAPPPAAIVHAIPADAIVVQAVRAPQVAASVLIPRSQSARAPPALT